MMVTPLEIDAVDASYGNGPVLEGVTLRVEAGELVALVGSSGAGKSTTLGLACGLLAPVAGRIRTLGVDLAGADRRERRSVLARVGYVPQQVLMPGRLRVVHNVNSGRLGSWSVARSLRSLVAPVEMDVAIAALDRLGIGDLVDARTDTLSGGQLQRVALARVLVQRPSLVLADEPVSAVDPAWSVEMLDALTELAAADGCGVLVSLHDADLALERCHRIVALRAGRVWLDAPTDLVARSDLDALYRLARPTHP